MAPEFRHASSILDRWRSPAAAGEGPAESMSGGRPPLSLDYSMSRIFFAAASLVTQVFSLPATWSA